MCVCVCVCVYTCMFAKYGVTKMLPIILKFSYPTDVTHFRKESDGLHFRLLIVNVISKEGGSLIAQSKFMTVAI